MGATGAQSRRRQLQTNLVTVNAVLHICQIVDTHHPPEISVKPHISETEAEAKQKNMMTQRKHLATRSDLVTGYMYIQQCYQSNMEDVVFLV